jgi:hypothetical protein
MWYGLKCLMCVEVAKFVHTTNTDSKLLMISKLGYSRQCLPDPLSMPDQFYQSHFCSLQFKFLEDCH